MSLIVPLVFGAVSIAVLGSIDSLLTSVIADKLTNSRHDSNKELIGQGLGNIATGLIGGLAGAGSTTRTIANIDSGGRTALSGIVYGALMFLVITQFGSAASTIPLTGLAAVLIYLACTIIDKRMFGHLLKAPRADVFVMLIVMGVTVFGDLITAVILGIALSCIFQVKRIADSSLSVFCPLAEFVPLDAEDLRTNDSELNKVYLYRCHGPLFFAELKNMQDCIDSIHQCKVLVFDLENVSFIDQSCSYYLEDTINSFAKRGVIVLLVNVSIPVKEALIKLNCKAVLDGISEKVSWPQHALKLAQNTPVLQGGSV